MCIYVSISSWLVIQPMTYMTDIAWKTNYLLLIDSTTASEKAHHLTFTSKYKIYICKSIRHKVGIISDDKLCWLKRSADQGMQFLFLTDTFSYVSGKAGTPSSSHRWGGTDYSARYRDQI